MKTVASFAAAFAALLLGGTAASAAESRTATPIRHVIVVVGENVTFDTLFGTYVPPQGSAVRNLLSERIVNADGTPGADYQRAVQRRQQNRDGKYTIDLVRGAPYAKLPQPYQTGVLSYQTLTFAPTAPDPRFASLSVNGPFQITSFVPYNSPVVAAPATTGDPVHRFFQMWQQTGGTNERLDRWTWVATTVGTGGGSGVTAADPGQGGELMGFYNMSKGDASVFRKLAQGYAISDNYHQAVMGGTGANFFHLATGDAAVYQIDGVPLTPPANQIENPDPQASTENFYTQDGYSGGSYVKCADPVQPGVAAIKAVLDARGRKTNCAPGAYYLVNNYNPGYDIDGKEQALGPDKFVYPPQLVPTIGEKLTDSGVTWGWYTGGRDDADITSDFLFPALKLLTRSKLPPGTPDAVVTKFAIEAGRPLVYNNIGDPLNASANVQSRPEVRKNLKGLASFYGAVADGTLPEVSFVVPKNLDSGHPGYSVPGRYEVFIDDLVKKVQANPALWADTAILVTTDEGGGYFDSGWIQPIDFFGDGPRIPLIAVSPWVRPGHVDHTYNDHASVLKFIERNWRIRTALSDRSRDNLRNPQHDEDAYRPSGRKPRIGDLMSLFSFRPTEDEHGRDDD